MMRVLVVEDSSETAAFIRKALAEAGHVVDIAGTGPLGDEMARSQAYDVLVFDRMLPGRDGLSVVTDLRVSGVRTPALGEVEHRVEGLKAGGDDYLAKPYAASELIARVEALGRRGDSEPAQTHLKVGDLEMDLLSRVVRRAGRKIDIQPREFKLLEYLMRNAGQVVTRTMLLEKVWDYHFDPQTNVIDVHVSRLRAKIDKDFPTAMLRTVRGSGYRLES
jgi:two-component system, OmpR family, response regulator